MKPVIARAPGKIILFGEHAVVYGVHGLACAIDKYTTVTVNKTKADGKIIIHNWGETKETTKDECKALYEKVQELAKGEKYNDMVKELATEKQSFMKYIIGSVINLGIDVKDIDVTAESELCKGMGGSAAMASAAVLALTEYFRKPMQYTLTKEKINELAYQCDVFAHGGRPSGIDNTTVVNGGYIMFRKDGGMERLITDTKLNVVIGDTKVRTTTGKMVENLRKLQSRNKKVKKAIQDVEQITDSAVDALKTNDTRLLGKLMDENQRLLEIMKVSHPKLRKLITAAKRAGALGAKLSGAGGGGIMYALATEENKDAIASAITNAGGEAIIAKLGVEGVKLL